MTAMQRRLKIAMIGQRGVPASYGGIERHVEELGARLVDMGHEVVVYCRPTYSSSQLETYRGMTLRHVRTPHSKHLEAIVHSAGAAACAIRDRCDVIHFHAMGPGLVAPLPRLLSRAKVVQTVHGLDQDREKWGRVASSVLQVGEWTSAHVPDATIVVSRALREHYRTRYGMSTPYICNGVAPYQPDESAGKAVDELGLTGARYLLFVGRLVPEKAPDLLIKAFRRIVGDDLRLVLAGGSCFTDGYEGELRELAATDPRVLMLGNVDPVPLQDLYAHASAFVLASNVEGMPLTLLEAASHGLPVLVSDIAPHREMVGTSSPGRRLFERGNEDALVSTLTAMLDDLGTERAGARAARARVLETFSWDRAACELEELYLSLITGAIPRGDAAEMSARQPLLDRSR